VGSTYLTVDLVTLYTALALQLNCTFLLLPDQLLQSAYDWTLTSCNQLFTFSTILAAAYLWTILNARMQSIEKNHNWRNFDNLKKKYIARDTECFSVLIKINFYCYHWNISSQQSNFDSKEKCQIQFPPLLFPNTWFNNPIFIVTTTSLTTWWNLTCYSTVQHADGFDWTMFSFCPDIVQFALHACCTQSTSLHRPLVWNALCVFEIS